MPKIIKQFDNENDGTFYLVHNPNQYEIRLQKKDTTELLLVKGFDNLDNSERDFFLYKNGVEFSTIPEEEEGKIPLTMPVRKETPKKVEPTPEPAPELHPPLPNPGSNGIVKEVLCANYKTLYIYKMGDKYEVLIKEGGNIDALRIGEPTTFEECEKIIDKVRGHADEAYAEAFQEDVKARHAHAVQFHWLIINSAVPLTPNR